MASHKVKLTDSEKVKWFQDQINERLKVKKFESEQEFLDFCKFCRRTFKELYGRDVPGSFIRRLIKDMGFERDFSDSTKAKRDFMFHLMDTNRAFRENKTQLRKAVESRFGEKILGIVFDELWDEYHKTSEHPKPDVDIDLYGQTSLFDEDS